MNQSSDFLEMIIPEMDNDSLLNLHQQILMNEARTRKSRERIEFILRQRMEADGASSIAHETLTCELVYPSPTYDYGKLRALAELVPPHVLAEAFWPEHEEVLIVPDKWDARVFKTWAKYGHAVQEVISAAAIPGTPRLRIKPKEEEKA